ncbi:MAG: tRNA uridine-5-carboxymethylaminomethyl(34) synthesis GTPase MnmE [Campylobacterota bacterium]
MTSENSTIAATATASGVASISIVRISGPQALHIAKTISAKDDFTPRMATLSYLYDSSGEAIDQAIIIYFKAPYSFTGEDVVELQCHGGISVSQLVLQSTLDYGAVLATPGEFSKRAFLNGKIDLTKAEATAKLIESKSLDAAKILTKQLQGDLQEFVDRARDELIGALAYSEVSIDYAEEDLPGDLKQSLQSKLHSLKEQFARLVDTSKRKKGLIEGFKAAIIGKPNVGKSSILNRLLAQNRAIVSDIAGTTRDTIEEQLLLGTHLIRIVDTAGIRQSSETIETIGIEKSMEAMKQSDIVIAVFDGSQPLDDEDEKILSLLHESDKKLFVCINKSDLTIRIDRSRFKGLTPIEICAAKELDALTGPLLDYLDSSGTDEELMLVGHRQITAVQEACKEIENALVPLQNEELEFFSYHLQEAAKAIASISRPFDSEEVLDSMFGEFCLGK